MISDISHRVTCGSLSASLQESWSLKEDQVLFSGSHVITLFFLLSKSATDVKVTADMVREALEEAEKAQIAAEKAIKQDEDIQGTQNLLTSVRDCSHCCVWEKHTHTYICQERSTSDHYL